MIIKKNVVASAWIVMFALCVYVQRCNEVTPYGIAVGLGHTGCAALIAKSTHELQDEQ